MEKRKNEVDMAYYLCLLGKLVGDRTVECGAKAIALLAFISFLIVAVISILGHTVFDFLSESNRFISL